MKSNQNLSILFWHRKSKADSNGLAPIICRISIDGLQKEFSIARKVQSINWDIQNKRVSSCIDAKRINSELNRIQSELEKHFTVLQTRYDLITPIMLRNSYKCLPIDSKEGFPRPKMEVKVPTLLELVNLHIESFTLLVDKKLRSKETLKQWKSTRKK